MATALTTVSGIGPVAAAALEAAGIDNVEDLAKAEINTIANAKGFGPARATQVRARAQALLNEDVPAEAPGSDPKPSTLESEPTKPKKKAKDDKKKKKKKSGKSSDGKKDKKKKTKDAKKKKEKKQKKKKK